jgi:hypothetical protein
MASDVPLIGPIGTPPGKELDWATHMADRRAETEYQALRHIAEVSRAKQLTYLDENDLLHRLDGPALISDDGRHSWFLHDQPLVKIVDDIATKVLFDTAYGDPRLTVPHAHALLTHPQLTERLRAWLCHVLLANPSTDLADPSWRVLTATNAL